MDMRFLVETSIRNRIIPILDQVEKEWGFQIDTVQWVEDINTVPHTIIDFMNEGKHWRLIFPANGGDLFIVDYTKHPEDLVTYAGGAIGDGNKKLDSGDRATIIVFGNETAEILKLRIVHELLHAIDLPADDLDKHTTQFLPWWDLRIYNLRRKYGMMYGMMRPEHDPRYQKKYYRWLLNQRAIDRM